MRATTSSVALLVPGLGKAIASTQQPLGAVAWPHKHESDVHQVQHEYFSIDDVTC
jgi:hypothetical protein